MVGTMNMYMYDEVVGSVCALWKISLPHKRMQNLQQNPEDVLAAMTNSCLSLVSLATSFSSLTFTQGCFTDVGCLFFSLKTDAGPKHNMLAEV